MTTSTGTAPHGRQVPEMPKAPSCRSVEGCTAKRHGTRAAYMSDGCRCPSARAANTAYQIWRTRRSAHVAAGAVPPLTVPVEQTRSVLEQLLGIGWSRRRIAAASGVKRDRLSRISGGTCHPVRRVRWATHAALVALLEQDTVPLADGALVDAYPTWQRIHGLIALGYPKTWIAGQLSGGRALQLHEFTVTARNAEKVRALADTYGATPGPSDAARQYAAKRGWTPDLIWQADEPALAEADDGLDEIALERACSGEQVSLTGAERLEAVRRLRNRGLPVTHIAERLHVSGQRINSLVARIAQQDRQEATA